jgi:hypothetical protein
MDTKEFIIDDRSFTKINKWINTHLKAYLDKYNKQELKQEERLDRGDLDHIIDFLKQTKNNTREKITRLGVMDAHKQAVEWTERLNKKVTVLNETEQDVQVIYQYDDGFYWVKLLSENSYKREGKLMQHCVGSYADKKGSVIFSLRDATNDPHCTVEYSKAYNGEERINQIKGKQNRAVVSKYHKYVCDFLERINVKLVSSYDLEANGLIKANGKIYFISNLPEGITLESNLTLSNPEKIPTQLAGKENVAISIGFYREDQEGRQNRRYFNQDAIKPNENMLDLSMWWFFDFSLNGVNAKLGDLKSNKLDLHQSKIIFKTIESQMVSLDASTLVGFDKLKVKSLLVENCDSFVLDSKINAEIVKIKNVKKLIVNDSNSLKELELSSVGEIQMNGTVSLWNLKVNKCNLKNNIFEHFEMVPDKHNSPGAIYLDNVTNIYDLKLKGKVTNLTLLKIENSSICNLYNIKSIAFFSNKNTAIKIKENCEFESIY